VLLLIPVAGSTIRTKGKIFETTHLSRTSFWIYYFTSICLHQRSVYFYIFRQNVSKCCRNPCFIYSACCASWLWQSVTAVQIFCLIGTFRVGLDRSVAFEVMQSHCVVYFTNSEHGGEILMVLSSFLVIWSPCSLSFVVPWRLPPIFYSLVSSIPFPSWRNLHRLKITCSRKSGEQGIPETRSLTFRRVSFSTYCRNSCCEIVLRNSVLYLYSLLYCTYMMPVVDVFEPVFGNNVN
jgi:hypothetical protein